VTLLDRITAIHGRLSDLKAVWWPFLFLKPESHMPITFGRTLVMAPCFALYFFVFYLLRELVLGRSLDPSTFALTFGKFCLGFAIWMNVATRPLWNRRANQLARSNSA
jgi:hypothetical protein